MRKFQKKFQNPRQISNQIGEVIFWHTMYSRLKRAKSAFFGDFTIFPLLNPYSVTNFSIFVSWPCSTPLPYHFYWPKLYLGMSPNILTKKNDCPPQKIPCVLEFHFPYSYSILWPGPNIYESTHFKIFDGTKLRLQYQLYIW